MEAVKLARLWPTWAATPSSSSSSSTLLISRFPIPLCFFPSASFNPKCSSVVRRCVTKEEEPLLEGLPKEYYDDEWQAKQREKTKEFERLRKAEDDEEERKIEEYREIGKRMEGFPEEDVRNAKKLVSSFIRAEEEVEERIVEAAEKGELTDTVLMVIWNRLDLARRDEERDAIRSLDLLYRRVETEILKREATPSMRLLNELLSMYDGFKEEDWRKGCKKRMVDTFPREDPFSILLPTGFDLDKHEGPLPIPPEEDDNILFRADFVREVAALLEEVKLEQSKVKKPEGFDAESIASRMKQQEKQQAISQVEDILELAINLTW